MCSYNQLSSNLHSESKVETISVPVCGLKTPAGRTVFSWVRGFNIGKETAQAAVHEWYCNTPEEWLSEVIWKLSRRWQQCITCV
jgi:hypothetical protein